MEVDDRPSVARASAVILEQFAICAERTLTDHELVAATALSADAVAAALTDLCARGLLTRGERAPDGAVGFTLTAVGDPTDSR